MKKRTQLYMVFILSYFLITLPIPPVFTSVLEVMEVVIRTLGYILFVPLSIYILIDAFLELFIRD